MLVYEVHESGNECILILRSGSQHALSTYTVSPALVIQHFGVK
jgi:hypothetical protein